MKERLVEIQEELLNAKLDLANVNDRYSEIENVEELRYLQIVEEQLKLRIDSLYKEYLMLTNENEIKSKKR